jgi:hypothetical protein
MAEANHSLTPNRIAERTRRHHAAVRTLALQSASKAVERQLQAKGLKVSLIPSRDIAVMAKDYFAQHHVRLIAEAKAWIATSPYFAEWRLAGVHKTTEH